MKKIYCLAVAVCSIIYLQAQQKFDTVYMKNSDVNVGSITAINDGSINFTYKGETLGYTFKKNDIVKIVFSSGRTENINNPDAVHINKSTASHHNNVAVLPFAYINPNQETNIEMGYKVQEECYTILSNKASALTIQDPSTTNALLGKAGVSFDNVRNFTLAELCDILGVEYVVKGTISANITSTTSTGSASYDAKTKDGTSKGSSTSKSTGNVYASGSTQDNFKTSVLMEIYTDEGKKIYGQDRTSFWTTVDAYKSTLQYLLKKCPIYER